MEGTEELRVRGCQTEESFRAGERQSGIKGRVQVSEDGKPVTEGIFF